MLPPKHSQYAYHSEAETRAILHTSVVRGCLLAAGGKT